MGFRRYTQEPPKIDLTPMVDIVFLLVIFFMISTTFIEQPGVKIDLPVANSQYQSRDAKEIRAYLTDKGDIYLQRKKVSWTEFRDRLSSYDADTAKNMIFILMADENSRHGDVIRLMDVAKRMGISRLVIATDNSVSTEN